MLMTFRRKVMLLRPRILNIPSSMLLKLMSRPTSKNPWSKLTSGENGQTFKVRSRVEFEGTYGVYWSLDFNLPASALELLTKQQGSNYRQVQPWIPKMSVSPTYGKTREIFTTHFVIETSSKLKVWVTLFSHGIYVCKKLFLLFFKAAILLPSSLTANFQLADLRRWVAGNRMLSRSQFLLPYKIFKIHWCTLTIAFCDKILYYDSCLFTNIMLMQVILPSSNCLFTVFYSIFHQNDYSLMCLNFFSMLDNVLDMTLQISS